MNQLIGHTHILNFLSNARANQTLSHAYCFIGPDHVGKRAIAEHLAAEMLHIESSVYHHPDFFFIEQQKNEKTGKTKKGIDTDQIRTAIESISRSAMYGGYKIVVIDNAEKLNTNAANALLKTLEEPPDKSLIILLSNQETALPKTILSRCQTLYVTPVSNEIIQALLTQHLTDTEQIDEMTRLSDGLPGRVLSWLAQPELFEQYKQELLRLQSISTKAWFVKIANTEALFGDKTDHIEARDHLIDVLTIWQKVIRDSILSEALDRKKQYHIQITLPRTPQMQIALLDQIQDAIQLLKHNIHPRLVVERILLTLP